MKPTTDQCYFKAKIGNEICDDLANTEECSYDGGKYHMAILTLSEKLTYWHFVTHALNLKNFGAKITSFDAL